VIVGKHQPWNFCLNCRNNSHHSFNKNTKTYLFFFHNFLLFVWFKFLTKSISWFFDYLNDTLNFARIPLNFSLITILIMPPNLLDLTDLFPESAGYLFNRHLQFPTLDLSLIFPATSLTLPSLRETCLLLCPDSRFFILFSLGFWFIIWTGIPYDRYGNGQWREGPFHARLIKDTCIMTTS